MSCAGVSWGRGSGAGVFAGGGGAGAGAGGLMAPFKAMERPGEAVTAIAGSGPGGEGSATLWLRFAGVGSGGTNARNGGALAVFTSGLVSREDSAAVRG